MITFKEIHTAIVDKLKSKFSSIKVKDIDPTAITRPSFSVDFNGIKTSDFMNEALEKNLTVRIYYFATTAYKNKLENLNIQDDLIELFMEDNITTTESGAIIQVDEVDFDTVDGVLEMSFKIMVSENYDRTDEHEYMNNLEINLEKESDI